MDYSPQNVTFPVKMDFNPFLPVIPAFYGMYSISIASYGITSAAIGDGAQKRENESGPKEMLQSAMGSKQVGAQSATHSRDM